MEVKLGKDKDPQDLDTHVMSIPAKARSQQPGGRIFASHPIHEKCIPFAIHDEKQCRIGRQHCAQDTLAEGKTPSHSKTLVTLVVVPCAAPQAPDCRCSARCYFCTRRQRLSHKLEGRLSHCPQLQSGCSFHCHHNASEGALTLLANEASETAADTMLQYPISVKLSLKVRSHAPASRATLQRPSARKCVRCACQPGIKRVPCAGPIAACLHVVYLGGRVF